MFGPYPVSSRPLSGRRTFKTGAVFFLLALHLLAPARAFWKCEPLRIPACAAMPYNVTRMPNLLQQGTQGSAALALHRFELLVRRSCSAVLPFFLCAMYAPICTISFRLETVPPCRDVCERARAGCEPEMRVYNLSWPENLDCKKLPRYDRGVCVSPETILASPPKGCQCKRKLRLRRKLLRRRRHDFALHVKFNHTITTKKKYAIVVLYTKDIMKDEQSRILPNSIIHLWVKRTCQCSWTKDEEYLILGKYNQKGRLTLSRKSIVTQWRKGWTLLMKKWQTNAGLKKGPAERLNRRQNRRRTKEAKRKRRTIFLPSGNVQTWERTTTDWVIRVRYHPDLADSLATIAEQPTRVTD